jgi:hypothetical protein
LVRPGSSYSVAPVPIIDRAALNAVLITRSLGQRLVHSVLGEDRNAP